MGAGVKKAKNRSVTNWQTFLDIKDHIDKKSQKMMINKAHNTILIHKKIPKEIDYVIFWGFTFKLYRHFGLIKILYFYFNKLTNRFHAFRKFALEA